MSMRISQKPKRILIMAAGTGGHIFPGLAIAKTLQERGWEVSWLGTKQGMEAALVEKNHIAMDAIDFAGMRGKGWRHAITGAWKLLKSFWHCYQFLDERRPDVVLGMGGYVTVPGGLMAKLRGIPLVLMNADAALLLSTKLLMPFAKQILFGFPTKAGKKVQVTGNPVRQAIATLSVPKERFAHRIGPLRILVVGGSLGAQVLNRVVPAALAILPTELRPIVTHQSGQQHLSALQAAYENAQVQANVVAFIDDMAEQYANVDLVICRAGAITVAELTAAGVGSVLVPLMVSSTTHQTENAEWMAQKQAAIHLPQAEMTAEKLARMLSTLKREDCLALAEAAYQLGRREANEMIADVLGSLVGPHNTSSPRF
jgi:UDP-N-acetylglucosamine--N-acetylmuramyl-(pentapeptide) pyrophosphoryl-undecaprenol N-acetylglucosamine transferase